MKKKYNVMNRYNYYGYNLLFMIVNTIMIIICLLYTSHDDYTNFEIDFERDKVRNTVLNRYTKEQKEALLKRAQKHNQRIKELEFKVQPYYQQYISDGQIYYYYIPKDLRDMFLYLILRDVMHPQLISQSLIAEIKHQINSCLLYTSRCV